MKISVFVDDVVERSKFPLFWKMDIWNGFVPSFWVCATVGHTSLASSFLVQKLLWMIKSMNPKSWQEISFFVSSSGSSWWFFFNSPSIQLFFDLKIEVRLSQVGPILTEYVTITLFFKKKNFVEQIWINLSRRMVGPQITVINCSFYNECILCRKVWKFRNRMIDLPKTFPFYLDRVTFEYRHGIFWKSREHWYYKFGTAWMVRLTAYCVLLSWCQEYVSYSIRS